MRRTGPGAVLRHTMCLLMFFNMSLRTFFKLLIGTVALLGAIVFFTKNDKPLGSLVFNPFTKKLDYTSGTGTSTDWIVSNGLLTTSTTIPVLLKSNLFVSSTALIDGAVTLGSDLTVAGTAYIHLVDGLLGFFQINLGGFIHYSFYTDRLDPRSNNSKDLGSFDASWKDVYVSSTVFTQALNVKGLSTLNGGFISSASSTVSAPFNVSGTSTLSILQVPGIAPRSIATVVSSTAFLFQDDVDIQGQYAYAGVNSLNIINTASPTPYIVGTLFDNQNGAALAGVAEINVFGKYAYITAATDNAFEIADVSDPVAPRHVAVMSDSASQQELSGAKGVKVVGNYAYVTAESGDAFNIIDISNPVSPRFISKLVDATNLDGAAYIEVRDGMAFVSNANASTITILDVSNPNSISIIATSTAGLQPREIELQGNFLYVTSVGDDSIITFDISNPWVPKITDVFTSTNLDIPRGLSVQDGYLYVASQTTNKLLILDTTDPNNLVELTSAGTTTGPQGIRVVGNRVYIAGTASVQIMDVFSANLRSANIGSLNVGGLRVLDDSFFDSNLRIHGGLNVGNGLALTGCFGVNDATSSIYGISGCARTGLTLFNGTSTTTLTTEINVTSTIARILSYTSGPQDSLVLNDISSGTVVAGFGPCLRFDGERVTGGAAVQYGKVCGTAFGGSSGQLQFFPAFTGVIYPAMSIDAQGLLTIASVVPGSAIFGMTTTTISSTGLTFGANTTTFRGGVFTIDSSGNTSVSGTLRVSGIFNASSSILYTGSLIGNQSLSNQQGLFFSDSSGNTFASGTLRIFGLSTLAGFVSSASSSIGSSLNVSGNLNASSSVYLSGCATTTFSLFSACNLSVSGLSTFNGLLITASSTFTKGLNVTGPLNASSSVFYTGTLMGNQSLSNAQGLFFSDASGNTFASGTLRIFGLSTLTGFNSIASSSIGSSLNVSGNLNASSSVYLSGCVTTTFTLLSACNLSVSGLSTFNGLLITASSTFTTGLSIGGSLNASGTANFSQNVVQWGIAPTLIGVADNDTSASTTALSYNDVVLVGRTTFFARNLQEGSCNTTSTQGCEILIYDNSTSTPVYIGGIDIGKNARGFAVQGNYLYLAAGPDTPSCVPSTGVSCEIQIWDISNLSNPRYISGIEGGNNIQNTVTIYSHYMYISANFNVATCSLTQLIGCEIKIIDIADPLKPRIAGFQEHGFAVQSITISGNWMYVGKAGRNVFCSVTTTDGCEFIQNDISIPTSPSTTAVLDFGSISVNDIQVQGNLIYIAKNADSGGTCSNISQLGCEEATYDVSSSTGPRYVGGIELSVAANSLAINGRYLIIGKATDATTCTILALVGCEVNVFDVFTSSTLALSTFSSFQNVGGVDNGGVTINTIVVGGHYMYAATAGNIGTCSLASPIGCETQNYDLGGMEVPTLIANALEAGGLVVRGNSRFNGNVVIDSSLTVGPGGIFSQGALSASGTIKLFGTASSTFVISNGVASTTLSLGSLVITDGTTTTVFSATGLTFAGNNTTFLMGLFNVDSSGNVSTSGTMSVAATTTLKDGLISTKTTNIGWSVQAAANQACNTTCTNACVFGEDTSVIGSFVDCSDATADRCVCAGAN